MIQNQLLDTFKKRISYVTARRVLAKYKFPKATGWVALAEKLNDPTINSAVDHAGLGVGLAEMLVSTDKTVRVYKVTSKDAQALRNLVSNWIVDKTLVFSQPFPAEAHSSVVAQLKPQLPQVVSKFSGSLGSGLLLSCLSIIDVRERLSPSQAGVPLGTYDEIFGIKKLKLQTFDAVMVSNNNDYVYVLTDNHYDVTQSTRAMLNSNVSNEINRLLGTNALSDAVNLKKYIEKIYNSGRGAVKRLHYTTMTSSGKQEWMRGNGNCLRQELGHKAGMTALSGAFQSYGISVQFDLPKSYGYVPRPELAIIGSYRMTYEPNPVINNAAISGCANIEELEATLSELMVHLIGTKTI